MQLLLVFIGGGLGAVSRYYLGLWLSSLTVNSILGDTFLNATFIINMLACVVAGIISATLEGQNSNCTHRLKALLLIGYFGGFSTLATVDLVPIQSFATLDIFHALTNGYNFILLINISCGIGLALLACRITISLRNNLSMKMPENVRTK